jgi:hypothetical protein
MGKVKARKRMNEFEKMRECRYELALVAITMHSPLVGE